MVLNRPVDVLAHFSAAIQSMDGGLTHSTVCSTIIAWDCCRLPIGVAVVIILVITDSDKIDRVVDLYNLL